VDDAVDFAFRRYKEVQDAFPGKPVVIGRWLAQQRPAQ